MSKYIAYIKQEQGCDYTICCGEMLIELNSINIKDAQDELKKEVLNYGEDEITSAVLYEVLQLEIMPVLKWHEEEKSRKLEQKQMDKEKAERIEYERLRKKFENIT